MKGFIIGGILWLIGAIWYTAFVYAIVSMVRGCGNG